MAEPATTTGSSRSTAARRRHDDRVLAMLEAKTRLRDDLGRQFTAATLDPEIPLTHSRVSMLQEATVSAPGSSSRGSTENVLQRAQDLQFLTDVLTGCKASFRPRTSSLVFVGDPLQGGPAQPRPIEYIDGINTGPLALQYHDLSNREFLDYEEYIFCTLSKLETQGVPPDDTTARMYTHLVDSFYREVERIECFKGDEWDRRRLRGQADPSSTTYVDTSECLATIQVTY